MTRDELKEYWINLADYDLATAKDLFTSKRWIYVAFMCHQALEKTLKAYWCSKKVNDPPYIHNLTRLCEGCGISLEMSEEQLSFIDIMMPMNIEARYPSYRESIASSLDENTAAEIINQTENLQRWIKSKL